MSNGDMRPEDYAALQTCGGARQTTLHDVGIAIDPNCSGSTWHPRRRAAAPGPHDVRVRQAISSRGESTGDRRHRLSRRRGPDLRPGLSREPQLVFGHGAAVRPRPGRATELLTAAGLTDRNGDGALKTRMAAPLRFSILTQKGNTTPGAHHLTDTGAPQGRRPYRRHRHPRRRAARKIGESEYDAIYSRPQRPVPARSRLEPGILDEQR